MCLYDVIKHRICFTTHGCALSKMHLCNDIQDMIIGIVNSPGKSIVCVTQQPIECMNILTALRDKHGFTISMRRDIAVLGNKKVMLFSRHKDPLALMGLCIDEAFYAPRSLR